jgi:hypothetical protein
VTLKARSKRRYKSRRSSIREWSLLQHKREAYKNHKSTSKLFLHRVRAMTAPCKDLKRKTIICSRPYKKYIRSFNGSSGNLSSLLKILQPYKSHRKKSIKNSMTRRLSLLMS